MRGDVLEILLVAIAYRDEVVIYKFVLQIHEENNNSMLLFDSSLNFLVAISAFNKKVLGFLVGAITIEAFDSHTLEVLE